MYNQRKKMKRIVIDNIRDGIQDTAENVPPPSIMPASLYTLVITAFPSPSSSSAPLLWPPKFFVRVLDRGRQILAPKIVVDL